MSVERIGDTIVANHISRGIRPREQALWTLFEQVLAEDTHAAYHKFDRFMEERGHARPYTGADAQEDAEAYAEQNPDWVVAVGIDDDAFTSSTLLVIRHGTGDNYMGLSAVFIPQCTTATDRFFLYPDHQKQLSQALTKLGIKEPAEKADYLARYARKPSAFDAINDGWKSKPWWKEKWSRVRQLANGSPDKLVREQVKAGLFADEL